MNIKRGVVLTPLTDVTGGGGAQPSCLRFLKYCKNFFKKFPEILMFKFNSIFLDASKINEN